MTHRIMLLSTKSLFTMTLRVTTYSVKSHSITTFRKMALRIMSHSIITTVTVTVKGGPRYNINVLPNVAIKPKG